MKKLYRVSVNIVNYTFITTLVSCSYANLPFILQVGVELFHVLSALHVRVIDVETVNPVLQLNVATDL